MTRVQLSTNINRLVLLTEPVVFCDNPNSDGLELRVGDSRGYNVLIDIVIISSCSPILGNTASEICIQAWESGHAAETTCKLDGTLVDLEAWSIMTLGERGRVSWSGCCPDVPGPIVIRSDDNIRDAPMLFKPF